MIIHDDGIDHDRAPRVRRILRTLFWLYVACLAWGYVAMRILYATQG